eukprot:evm.model.scf_1282.6 EVM.evm.TU.scf_1282.6   scf_1282:36268-39183(-)
MAGARSAGIAKGREIVGGKGLGSASLGQSGRRRGPKASPVKMFVSLVTTCCRPRRGQSSRLAQSASKSGAAKSSAWTKVGIEAASVPWWSPRRKGSRRQGSTPPSQPSAEMIGCGLASCPSLPWGRGEDGRLGEWTFCASDEGGSSRPSGRMPASARDASQGTSDGLRSKPAGGRAVFTGSSEGAQSGDEMAGRSSRGFKLRDVALSRRIDTMAGRPAFPGSLRVQSGEGMASASSRKVRSVEAAKTRWSDAVAERAERQPGEGPALFPGSLRAQSGEGMASASSRKVRSVEAAKTRWSDAVAERVERQPGKGPALFPGSLRAQSGEGMARASSRKVRSVEVAKTRWSDAMSGRPVQSEVVQGAVGRPRGQWAAGDGQMPKSGGNDAEEESGRCRCRLGSEWGGHGNERAAQWPQDDGNVNCGVGRSAEENECRLDSVEGGRESGGTGACAKLEPKTGSDEGRSDAEVSSSASGDGDRSEEGMGGEGGRPPRRLEGPEVSEDVGRDAVDARQVSGDLGQDGKAESRARDGNSIGIGHAAEWRGKCAKNDDRTQRSLGPEPARGTSCGVRRSDSEGEGQGGGEAGAGGRTPDPISDSISGTDSDTVDGNDAGARDVEPRPCRSRGSAPWQGVGGMAGQSAQRVEGSETEEGIGHGRRAGSPALGDGRLGGRLAKSVLQRVMEMEGGCGANPKFGSMYPNIGPVNSSVGSVNSNAGSKSTLLAGRRAVKSAGPRSPRGVGKRASGVAAAEVASSCRGGAGRGLKTWALEGTEDVIRGGVAVLRREGQEPVEEARGQAAVEGVVGRGEEGRGVGGHDACLWEKRKDEWRAVDRSAVGCQSPVAAHSLPRGALGRRTWPNSRDGELGPNGTEHEDLKTTCSEDHKLVVMRAELAEWLREDEGEGEEGGEGEELWDLTGSVKRWAPL